jgi:type IV pilus assembly protein PilB
MPHLKLGDILINQETITVEQLEQALSVQKQKPGRVGEILIGLGFVTEDDIASALGSQLGLPFYSSENVDKLTPNQSDALEKIVPVDFAKKNTILPLALNGTSLTCAVSDPLDLLMLDNLRRITSCDINLVIATSDSIVSSLNTFYFMEDSNNSDNSAQTSMLDAAVESSYDGSDKEEFASVTNSSASGSAELSLDKLIAKAGEAPVIKLVDLIIRQAIDEGASDIHIEPFENKINLRYRIDGKLYNIPPPAPHLHLAIVSRIKILSKLDIAEKRMPQDGAISAKLENRTVDIRISSIPTVWGEKVVMRILDKGKVPLELTGLGFTPKQIEAIRTALTSPYGLFYITGPTGSGKSTSLYAAVNEMIDPSKNIVTCEDPVEFKIEGLNQVSVRNDIGLTFATALKSFLRQDPDIIMVGETRDIETASICVRAALTGHFVLSTLHTNDAASAITRLIDIGVPNYLITPSLSMVMAQRLARKLCPKCKEPYEPDSKEHNGQEFRADLIYRGKGCEACKNTGYSGRVVVAECMIVTSKLRSLIAQGAKYTELFDQARKDGMETIYETGIRKVEEGITSFDEVCRISADSGQGHDE